MIDNRQSKGIDYKQFIKKQTVNNSVESKKETIINQIKNSIKMMLKTFLRTCIILAIESFVIFELLNYGIKEYALTYVNVFSLLLIIRLTFRNTVLNNETKEIK